jgi:hypothetical protein
MKAEAKKISAQKKRHAQKRLRRPELAPLNLEGRSEWDVWKLSYRFPDGFYRDRAFICKDCGSEEIWTARRQKWWFEEMHGDPDSTAIRCRACRIKERQRKMEARRISEEGMKRKLERMQGIK